jgi:hypothetical protein
MIIIMIVIMIVILSESVLTRIYPFFTGQLPLLIRQVRDGTNAPVQMGHLPHKFCPL